MGLKILCTFCACSCMCGGRCTIAQVAHGKVLSTGASVQTAQEVDSVLDAEDVRYFVTDTAQGGDVQDMEGAVLATPNDTQLWLRLAYSKLSNPAR